ncbi:HEXXH motif domain-containing protein [Actinoplanes sp. NPDC051411]|uniref:HEXXH motif domain-containing protein n=1 Tax=Actinoplanes sp. NPDC051411 TaxID=3155522 RepID=UPI003441C302
MTLERQVAAVPGRTTSRFHHVSASDFAELTSGGGTAAAVDRLAVSERSARFVVLYGLLRELLDRDVDAGPLPPADRARQLLAEVERADPQAADSALMYPLTGIWAAHLFRRLRGVVSDPAPLWLDLGYLHAIAAAAAIWAGIDFAIDIPVRHGLAVLPGTGYADFAGLDSVTARVETRAGRTTVSAEDRQVTIAPAGPGWRAATVCVAETAGARLEFVLDDFNPYRDLRGYSAPGPLSTEDVARWRADVAEAWEILVKQDQERAESVAAALKVLVPMPAGKRYRPLSASCDEAFAAVVASLPDDAEQLAATFIHETQHVRLGALLHLAHFVTEDPGPRLYAPWRDDPRPLPGLIQGTYAFTGLVAFFRGRGNPVARYEFALWRLQLHRVLSTLADHPALTPLGRRLVANLSQPVRQWMDEFVDPEIRSLAEAAADDHYSQWRCHHLPAASATVETMTAAWLARAPRPTISATPDPVPVVDRGVGRLDSRAVLARVRLREPQSFRALQAEPATGADQVPGVIEGDVHFVDGDHKTALDLYDRHLSAHPGDPRGWVGLGLSMAALGETPTTLLSRPELVRAVALRLAALGETVAALSLAYWFG